MVRERIKELRALVSISSTVISGEGRAKHRPNTEHAVLGPRLLGDSAKPDQGNLRGVNDSEHAFDA
jgi:hypothetical protein